ncbi:MAG: hypothetical protein PHO26_02275 [Dehalococcoidia bacterium]|nr:hypothetical protein [Dehalococcoidia bacterium]MDD5494879.1 hypothetical protein [Dehalococcoidia bacterium]
MAVVGPDGTPTESGSKILLAVKSGYALPDEIAYITSLALFTVTSGLKDLERVKLIRRDGEKWVLAERGIDLLS